MISRACPRFPRQMNPNYMRMRTNRILFRWLTVVTVSGFGLVTAPTFEYRKFALRVSPRISAGQAGADNGLPSQPGRDGAGGGGGSLFERYRQRRQPEPFPVLYSP
ncbi:exported hypothetical protein [Verrucomicrobia bacterium]|nr:exported hypothetical protein [Verrucomicrobiota bacterium]